MIDWIAGLRDHAARGPVAMIGILADEGSAPRGAGTRMIVTPDAAHGTIGGGQLEYRAVAQARALLAHPPGTWRVQDYPLGPLLGQCCGGRVRLLVEHVDPRTLEPLAGAGEGDILVTTLTEAAPLRRCVADAVPAASSARGERPGAGAVFVERLGRPRRPLLLFGAGHVGQAIARHAVDLPFRLGWFDTRPDFAAIDRVTIVPDSGIETCLADAPADAAILILTHDHALDYRLVRAALARPAPFAFTGLIGSRTKRARFLARLAADDVPDTARARLTCPIGRPDIPGKEPAMIAIATLAQLLALDAA